MSTFEDIIKNEGLLVYKTLGKSMEPMLRQDRDLVIIRAPLSRLKKNDVALYKRGKDYVLHRVIGVGKDYYLIRGDNTFTLEKVPDSNVIGVLTEFKRKGKLHKTSDISYMLYSKCWNSLYPVRAGSVRAIRAAKSISGRIGLTAFVKERMQKNAASKDDSAESDYYLAAQDVIYLLKCTLNEITPDKKQLQCSSPDAVFAVAKAHKLTAIVAMALEAGGIKSEKITKMKAAAMRRSIIFGAELSNVEARFNDAGIWYMPLKGIILQQYYPKSWLREMADHDILIDPDRAGDVKDIMESLGFTTEHFGNSNHDVYYKQPVLNYEIHTSLFGESHEKSLYEYYQNVESRLIREGSYRRSFTAEDFYIFMIAHEYKHYSGGGTGLRSLADTYVYLKKNSLDMDYVKGEAEKLGISEFEAANRLLAMDLFGSGQLTGEEKEMLRYILSSGTYGTITHSIENTIKMYNGNKLTYMLHRFFVPVSKKNQRYKVFAAYYPLFYKYKVLLPILPFYRMFRSIKRGAFMKEFRAIRNANK